MVHNIWSNAQLDQGARRIGQHKTNAKMFRNAYFVYLLGPAFLDINLALFMQIRIVRFNLELKKTKTNDQDCLLSVPCCPQIGDCGKFLWRHFLIPTNAYMHFHTQQLLLLVRILNEMSI